MRTRLKEQNDPRTVSCGYRGKSAAGGSAAKKLALAAGMLALLAGPGRGFDGNEFSLIPAGEFLMGSPEGEGGSDENPRHSVYLDAYYIGRREITVKQYMKFIKASGRKVRGRREKKSGSGDELLPVAGVDWNDADAYCRWAGGRLPTEAEWEKAARGGTGTKYSFGDDESGLGGYAWYDVNSNGRARPVGGRKPNQYGLYDMAGNVWEWVADWYADDYYKNSPAKDPKGPDSGSLRVRRGGAWGFSAYYLRAANRNWFFPDDRISSGGFRCVIPAQYAR